MRGWFTLNESVPGVCPVCGQCWSADPSCHCACTRPRADDEEQMAKAYAQSAACRVAKLHADTLMAERRMCVAMQRHQQRQRGTGNVVPLGRARPAPSASARRR